MSVFYLIGVGLHLRMISLEALDILKNSCDYIFYEEYTSSSSEGSLKDLEKLIGRKMEKLYRRDLEDLSGEAIIKKIKEGGRVCLVSWGDPLIATTHVALATRIMRMGYSIRYIPGVSSITASLSLTGLMIYRLGKVSTITYPKDGILSEYPYLVLYDNISRELHTIFLLEIDEEKKIFMNVKDALDILIELERRFEKKVISDDKLAIGLSIGSRSIICGGSIRYLRTVSIERYPQILIIPAKLYFTEEEYLRSIGVLEDRCIEI
ncbi:MAG: diphthine synthase [Sulfolobales archaeon]